MLYEYVCLCLMFSMFRVKATISFAFCVFSGQRFFVSVTFDHELKQFFVVRNFAGPFVFAIFELDVNFQDFVWKFLPKNLKFFAEVFCRRNRIYFGFGPFTFLSGKHVLILTISMQTWRFLLKRVWSGGAPRIFAPARTPQKPQIFGRDTFAVLLYNTKSKKQSTA